MVKEMESYINELEDIRKDRLQKIRDMIVRNFPGTEESFKYKMPTFEYNGNWVAAASQKKYLSVYFCSEELIKNIKEKHPEISCGKACVRIKDKDAFPLGDIKVSVEKAFNMKKL